jgi:hypothetical protein
LIPIVHRIIHDPLAVNGSIPSYDIYPLKTGKLARLSLLTSKDFRMNNSDEDAQIICIYKSGLVLTPGEVLNWTRKVKKLTSTRHRNALLRVAHADIFSNSRLFRFGLINEPKCCNCSNPNETLIHRLIECPLAARAWTRLEKGIEEIGLQSLPHITLESVLGTGDQINPNKVEMALRAELITRLTMKGGTSYCPEAMAKASIRSIATCEKLAVDLRLKMLNEAI